MKDILGQADYFTGLLENMVEDFWVKVIRFWGKFAVRCKLINLTINKVNTRLQKLSPEDKMHNKAESFYKRVRQQVFKSRQDR